MYRTHERDVELMADPHQTSPELQLSYTIPTEQADPIRNSARLQPKTWTTLHAMFQRFNERQEFFDDWSALVSAFHFYSVLQNPQSFEGLSLYRSHFLRFFSFRYSSRVICALNEYLWRWTNGNGKSSPSHQPLDVTCVLPIFKLFEVSNSLQTFERIFCRKPQWQWGSNKVVPSIEYLPDTGDLDQ